MNSGERINIIRRIPFSILWPLGAVWLFVVLHATNWLLFGLSDLEWIYLVPIVVLTPGWLVPLGKCGNVSSILLWILATILVSFFINFMAHYGLGAGDLGPGPV